LNNLPERLKVGSGSNDPADPNAALMRRELVHLDSSESGIVRDRSGNDWYVLLGRPQPPFEATMPVDDVGTEAAHCKGRGD
jgi:hypothetical protein